MLKFTSLAAAIRSSSRFLLQSRNYITAWERKLPPSSNGDPSTTKCESTDFIGTAGLYNDEMLMCTEDVCGNASESYFLDSVAILNEEEELVIAEDKKDRTIRYSDEDSTAVYETLRISTTRDVMHVAMRLLAKRGFSVTELRSMLEKFPLDIVDEVIEAMENRGYLNDCLYAESFSRSRFLHFLWGPELIKQALLQKGVAEVEAASATRRVFQDNYDYHNNMLHITISKKNNGYDYDVEEEMSQSAMDYLFLQASKQWRKEKGVSLDYRKVKLIRWLLDRGFSSRVTAAIIKRLWFERIQLD